MTESPLAETLDSLAARALERLDATGSLAPRGDADAEDLLESLATHLAEAAPDEPTLVAIGRADARRRTWLGVATSAAARHRLDDGSAWLAAAARWLDDSALTDVRGAGLAVVRARALDELGDESAAASWALALRRDPIAMALLPRREWSSGLSLARSGPTPKSFDAVLAFVDTNDASALRAFADAEPDDWASTVLASIVCLRAAFRAISEGDRGSADVERDAAERYLTRFDAASPTPEAVVLRALAALAKGDAATAEDLIRRELGTGDDAATTLLAALRTEALKPPFDLAQVLRTAWYETDVDPTTGLYVPRGGLSALRRALVGLVLVGTLASAAGAKAQDPNEVPDPGGPAPTHQVDGSGGGHSDFGGGGGGHHAFGGGGGGHRAFGGGGGHRAFGGG